MPEQFKSTPSHESTPNTEEISENGPSLEYLKQWKKVGILAMAMAKAMTADATASELPENLITHDATQFIESLKKAPSPEMKVTSTGTITLPKQYNLNTSTQQIKPTGKLPSNYNNLSLNNNFNTPKIPSGKINGGIHSQLLKGLKTVQTPKSTSSRIKLNTNNSLGTPTNLTGLGTPTSQKYPSNIHIGKGQSISLDQISADPTSDVSIGGYQNN